MEPANYPRRILLAVTGLSPQVVTETLYALAEEQQAAWIPTEIHLITTEEGAGRARLALLSKDQNHFQRLVEEYDLPAITFGEEQIHVLRDAGGNPLADIRTPEDNERAADLITALVKDFTADPDAALHVSIAGGRKTMGFYLGYALSLFGRAQDRLSHVLVSEPFESSWNFFYPTRESRVIETRNNALADTRDARVMLAEIPFVRLRGGLDQRLLAGNISFSDAVAAVRSALAPPSLRLDLAAGRIQAGDVQVKIPPAELALYSVFARRAMAGRPPLAAPPKEAKAADPKWAERFLAEYRVIRGGELDYRDATEDALRPGMDGDYFSLHLSRLHKCLRKGLGRGAGPYLIDNGGVRPRRYRLAIPADAITYGPVLPDSKPAGQRT
jgi:CRISPR-associated protein (TIGR02584 family)